MGSLYPGQRFETGGGLAELLPNLSVTFASPIYSSAVPTPAMQQRTPPSLRWDSSLR